MRSFPDVDIDFADRDQALSTLWHVPATLIDSEGNRTKHVTGVYFQNVPVDPIDNCCVYAHKDAGNYGYFKFDFLNLSLYRNIRDEHHLDKLIKTEVIWDLFLEREIVQELNQIKDHFDLIKAMKPRSVMDLAVCIALQRPGKRYLIGQPRNIIDAMIWLPEDKYYYKKSHAVAYATGIVVQLNLLVELSEDESINAAYDKQS